MADYHLTPAVLTRENFSDFGDVIETDNHQDIREINYGMTQRYHDLANLDLLSKKGQPLFSIFKSKPVTLPFDVKVFERHPLSSQLFYPLTDQPFLVLVAKSELKPEPSDLRLFITNGHQGVNYNKNIWHHYLLTLNQSTDFIVVDRGGLEENCDSVFFDHTIVIDPI